MRVQLWLDEHQIYLHKWKNFQWKSQKGRFQMFIYPHPSRSCWANMLGPDKEELIN